MYKQSQKKKHFFHFSMMMQTFFYKMIDITLTRLSQVCFLEKKAEKSLQINKTELVLFVFKAMEHLF